MDKKVLIYLPFVSDFYDGLYLQMQRGFRKAGCIVEGGCGYLNDYEFIKKIDQFKPDFVFEMNRTKSEIKGFPANLTHICWLVDYWERTQEEVSCGGSDILYLFSRPWLNEHKNFTGKVLDVLYPGTDPDVYYPKTKRNREKSLIFLGHMPKPWLDEELNRVIPSRCNSNIKFKDLVEFVLKPKSFDDGIIATKKFILDRLKVQDICTLNDRILHYDVYTRLFRESRRCGVVEKVVRSDTNINIYGSDNWKFRNQFAKHYKGNLSNPKDINEAFSQNSCLLHDGNMPHFKIFDAMSAGLIVLKPDLTNYGIEDEWSFLNFDEGINIFSYQLDSDLIGCLDSINWQKIEDTKNHIRDKIIASHAWEHRAEKILKDVNRC